MRLKRNRCSMRSRSVACVLLLSLLSHRWVALRRPALPRRHADVRLELSVEVLFAAISNE